MRHENCFLDVTWTMFVLLVRRFYPFLTAGRGRPVGRGRRRPHSLSREKVLHLTEHSLVLQRRFPSSSARECGRLARGRWASRPAVGNESR